MTLTRRLPSSPHLRHSITVLLLTAVIAGISNSAEQREQDPDRGRQPNIILLMADDLGWGDVGFNGNKVIQTPHLDALAQQGLKFHRFYAAAPVCSPTRGSCLTGRHPYRYGIFSANVGHLPAGELTLAELLKGHGYATGHFGKWHLGTLTKDIVDANRGGPRGAAHFSPPWENGFDVSFSTESKVPTWDPMLRPKGAKGNTWWDAVDDGADAKPYGTHYWSNGKLVEDDLRGDDSRIIMDRAIPFIREAAQDNKPFFAVIWFHAPHLPVVAGPKYAAMYADHDKHSQHYFGCITALDEQVGRLWAELGELGVRENTLLTFCSDNGPEGGENDPGQAGGLRGRKRSLFEGGVRVPGLAVWPAKIKAASVTDVPACTTDYLPTIVELLGAQRADERPLDGVSLVSLFAGEMDERPRPIAFQSAGQSSLVENRWKLIRTGGRKQNASIMLFDLQADRAETKNLAAEQPDRVENMAAELDAWQGSCAKSLSAYDGRP